MIKFPSIGGLDWRFGFGFEPSVLVEGKWETPPYPPNHKSKPQIGRKLNYDYCTHPFFCSTMISAGAHHCFDLRVQAATVRTAWSEPR